MPPSNLLISAIIDYQSALFQLITALIAASGVLLYRSRTLWKSWSFWASLAACICAVWNVWIALTIKSQVIDSIATDQILRGIFGEAMHALLNKQLYVLLASVGLALLAALASPKS